MSLSVTSAVAVTAPAAPVVPGRTVSAPAPADRLPEPTAAPSPAFDRPDVRSAERLAGETLAALVRAQSEIVNQLGQNLSEQRRGVAAYSPPQ